MLFEQTLDGRDVFRPHGVQERAGRRLERASKNAPTARETIAPREKMMRQDLHHG